MIIGISFASQFFGQEIWDIFERRKPQIQPAEDIAEEDINYVAGVLVKYVDAEVFKHDFTNTPLFDLSSKELGSKTSGELQSLADFCLFRVGFFPLGFNHRHQPPRKNYIYAGQKAYWRLSQKSADLAVFRSLALNFIIFANLISELKLRGASDKEIMQLIEFWQETGNHFAQEQLQKIGIFSLPRQTS